jgi:Ser/Thr protein kinase RdoA (MazF antagonist)
MSSKDTLTVAYATADASSVGAFVSERYDLGGTPICAPLNRGFNDAYVTYVTDSGRFVLRLSGRRGRGPADVAAETACLAYLDGAGVPVAAAIPTQEGALFTSATLPDGPREAVLFRLANGRRRALDAPDDARLQGMTLARIHTAADALPSWLEREVAFLLAWERDRLESSLLGRTV